MELAPLPKVLVVLAPVAKVEEPTAERVPLKLRFPVKVEFPETSKVVIVAFLVIKLVEERSEAENKLPPPPKPAEGLDGIYDPGRETEGRGSGVFIIVVIPASPFGPWWSLNLLNS